MRGLLSEASPEPSAAASDAHACFPGDVELERVMVGSPSPVEEEPPAAPSAWTLLLLQHVGGLLYAYCSIALPNAFISLVHISI